MAERVLLCLGIPGLVCTAQSFTDNVWQDLLGQSAPPDPTRFDHRSHLAQFTSCRCGAGRAAQTYFLRPRGGVFTNVVTGSELSYVVCNNSVSKGVLLPDNGSCG